jgi:transcriptional regulator of arginine metabolism
MRGRPALAGASSSAGVAALAGAAASTAPSNGSSATMAARGPSLVADMSSSAVGSKRDRQRAIRELARAAAVGSQQELVDLLIERGFAVTQATVSRDIAELGLIKAPRGGRHVYVVPEALGASGGSDPLPRPTDERLRRILADIPVNVGRSGLILLLTGSPGTASVIAQAIDESSLTEQEGTLAGDNTLLVLFGDEGRLLAWQARFDQIRTAAIEAADRA